MNIRTLTQHVLSHLCLALFVFLIPITFTAGIQQAHAQGMLVQDIRGTIQNTLQTISAQFLEQKEIVWDGLFFDIAQQALQQMTSSMLEWINSGNDGEPAFITDLDKYLTDAGDKVAGEFIYGDELSTLCEPFKIDVTVAAAESYAKEVHGSFKDEVACTLDKYSNDPAAFLKGDFNSGGWGAWFEVVLNPQNTPIGAKLMVEAETRELVEKEQEIKLQEANWGDGFIAQKVCSTVGSGDSAKEQCYTSTPASIIRDQAAFSLQIPALRLIQADEMNEVMSSLFGNLANQAITGINGLLGLGGNGSLVANIFGADGASSYLDAIRQESSNTQQGSSGTGGRIEQALRTQTRALDLQLDIVSAIDEVSKVFQKAHEPHANNSCWNLVFPRSLEEKLAELLKEVPQTIETIIALEELSKQYKAANSPTAELEILKEFSVLQTGGLLSGQTSVIQNEFYLNNELKSVIETFKKDIIAEEKSC